MRNLHTYLFFGLCLLLSVQGVLAQTSAVNAIDQNNSFPILYLSEIPDATLPLTPYTSVYIDKQKNLTLEDARDLWTKGKFTPLTKLDYPSKFESGAYHYWIQFEIENTSPNALDLIFRLTRLDSSFYYQFTDTQLDRQTLFGNRLKLEEIQKLGLPVLSKSSLPVQYAPHTRYQIFVRTSDNLYLTAKIQPEIESPYTFLKKQSKIQSDLVLFDSFFLGILFFIGLFTLFQYIQYRDPAFLFYALYVGLLFFLHWIMLDLENVYFKFFQHYFVDYLYFKIPLEIILYSTYVLFLQYFINEKNQYPFFTRLVKLTLSLFGIYFFVIIGISTISEVKYSWILHYYFRVSLIILAIPFLYNLWKIKNRLSNYLIVGSVSLFLFSILSPVLLSLTLKDKFWLGKDITYFMVQIGVLLELLCFSLGLGYKRYLAEKEKIKAQQEKQQVSQLETFKSQFYTNLTHEFRTPLTTILGMTEVLKEKLEKKQFTDTSDSVEMIQRNGQNLLQLVNDLLDLAKVESSNLSLNLHQADVIPFVKYLSESFHSMAEEKQIQLKIVSDVDSLVMDFDDKKLSIIVSNLLSNALKFTESNGQIRIHFDTTFQKETDYFLIKIKDNGIGISAKELPHIFNRFYQIDATNTRQKEGTGIGLALTKELVTLMNGTIEVRSELGKGSEFIIKIPVTRTAPKIAINEPLFSQKATVLPSNILPSTTKESDLPLALVIEDNADVAHYIKTCLTDQYQVMHAPNGQAGIEIAFEKIPDIIISDVMMPQKNGFEVCQTLKTDERTDHIPIILLTAKATTKDRLTGLTQGADAYLTKPFEKTELMIRLEKLRSIRITLQKKYRKGLVSQKATEKQITPINGFMQKVEQIVLNNLQKETFSVNELATALYLSRSQVHRKIKALTGMSAAIYIRHLRLLKAQTLIRTTDLTISEILYQVGFKSPAYFSQIYKTTFGVSPSLQEREI